MQPSRTIRQWRANSSAPKRADGASGTALIDFGRAVCGFWTAATICQAAAFRESLLGNRNASTAPANAPQVAKGQVALPTNSMALD